VCCSVLQCVAVCCSVLQCVAVCCSVLQCVAVCCSAQDTCSNDHRWYTSWHTYEWALIRHGTHVNGHTWVMAHIWMGTHASWHTCERAHMSYGTHMNGPPNLSTMGWLRLVGSLKLQVSFAEYSLFYRALLQKRPIILRSLLSVATPPYNNSHRWQIDMRHVCR